MMNRTKVALGSAVIALATSGSVVWWLTRDAPSLVRFESPMARAAEQAKQKDRRAGKVIEFSREGGVAGSTKLVALYGELAGDTTASGVRELALNALFAERAVALRLKRVLEAVVSDPTAPEQDPHWRGIVERLAKQWTPETFDKGRDLMLMEQRPRAQRALAASFVELSESAEGLSEAQRQALLSDLIDLYPKADPAQKPEIERGVRNLGGDDPADLLTGYGLKPGEKLKLQAQNEEQLARGVEGLGTSAPTQNDDED